MILIGMYDSPFVRRVAIAMHLYELPYEHQPWATFADADKIAPLNPLRRVPTLVLDDGEVLIDGVAILDYLDEQVDPGRRLIATASLERRQTLKVCMLATGLIDKNLALIYERLLHKDSSRIWVDRCRLQIKEALDMLEADLAGRGKVEFWFPGSLGHADITVAAALRQLRESFPDIFDARLWPNLAAHSDRCEGTELFQKISKPYTWPAA